MNRLAASLAIIILALLVISNSLAFSSKEKISDFTLPNLSGKIMRLSDHKGKTIFLNFFATWCPPCREEMPSIQKLYDSKIPKFIVLTIAIDRKGKLPVSHFIKNNNYSFNVLLDSKNEVSRKYEVQFVPTSFIINKKGDIVEKIIGPRDWASKEMIDRFRKLSK